MKKDTRSIRIDLETTIGRRTLHAKSLQDAVRITAASEMPVIRATMYDAHNRLLATLKTRQDERGRRWLGFYHVDGRPTWERRL